MDKFFNSTFDALTQVVPGSCFIGILYLFDPDIHNADDLLAQLSTINLGSAAFLVFVSYVIGFALGPVGRFLYTRLGFRLWPMKPQPCKAGITVSEKYVLVRQHSPANFKYIEIWNMFCNLSHNLGVVALFLLVASLYRIFILGYFNLALFGLAAGAVVLFLIFLHRAVVFRTWALNDLNATVDLVMQSGKGKD